ncbi:hypothetical protein [Psychroserpens sp. S379A]|uniref:hypothetical protein n=1 Tax=Psychroserpens sp. S379A TaxID=3415137 RepID=UPI003C7BD957
MTFNKKIFLNIPEYLLIAAVLFYWMSAGLVINYIAIVLLVIIILQMIYKNKVIGIIIPTIMILTCFYMIIALLSEVREFPSFNAEAQTLLFVGLAYFSITIIASIVMIIKYTSLSNKQ